MSMIKPLVSSDCLRPAYGCFPSGVTAICARVDGKPVGIVASSFTSVSLEPALVSVNMQHSSTTWPALRQRSRLGVSVLAEDQEEICTRLASKTGDRFAGTSTSTGHNDALFINGATLWLDCSVYAEVPAGDHDVVLLAVHGLWSDVTAAPLVFHGGRFRRLAAQTQLATTHSTRHPTSAQSALIGPWVTWDDAGHGVSSDNVRETLVGSSA